MIPPPPTSTLFPYTTLFRSLPQSREAISTVRASWNGYRGYPSDVRALQKLAARAEKERDANTLDRKSTRLNSSHLGISYAVFCLKKKKKKKKKEENTQIKQH